jgi:hypothetical protein
MKVFLDKTTSTMKHFIESFSDHFPTTLIEILENCLLENKPTAYLQSY